MIYQNRNFIALLLCLPLISILAFLITPLLWQAFQYIFFDSSGHWLGLKLFFETEQNEFFGLLVENDVYLAFGNTFIIALQSTFIGLTIGIIICLLLFKYPTIKHAIFFVMMLFLVIPSLLQIKWWQSIFGNNQFTFSLQQGIECSAIVLAVCYLVLIRKFGALKDRIIIENITYSHILVGFILPKLTPILIWVGALCIIKELYHYDVFIAYDLITNSHKALEYLNEANKDFGFAFIGVMWAETILILIFIRLICFLKI